jgi:hypothetical protein
MVSKANPVHKYVKAEGITDSELRQGSLESALNEFSRRGPYFSLLNTVMNNRPEEKFAFASDSAIRLMPENGIGFDAKGNAVYQGSHQHLLQNPLMDQELTLGQDTLPASLQARAVAGPGYNPYEHVAPRNQTVRTRKLDMRELSKWIEAKKRAEAQRNSEPEKS